MKTFFQNCIFFIFFVIFSFPLDTFACRYTVREIGFSDIGSFPYYLYVFTNAKTPEKDISTIKKLSYVLLNESNVKIKMINVDKEQTSTTIDYLKKYNIRSFPSAVFVLPEGESIFYSSFNIPGRSLNESVWLKLEGLVTSPIRKSIREKLLHAYCVVLVIEGKNKVKDRDAMGDVKEAVRGITTTLDQMPKIVNSPPDILVIPYKNTSDEKILLMRLGIKAEETDEPSVVVIYGRGRIMGPVLQGEDVTKEKISNLLTIVGADCECGLDNSWMLGRMIPMRWGPSVQSKLAKYLGFDVESPLVKSEMSQILSVKLNPDNPLNPLGDNLLGYSEGKLRIVKDGENVSKISATDIRKSFYQTKVAKNNMVFRTILMVLGGILLIVLVIGVFLFIKYKQENTIR